jgi:hypothetical protein
MVMMVAMVMRGKCRRGNRRKSQHKQGGENQLLHAATVALSSKEWKRADHRDFIAWNQVSNV